MSDTYLSLDVRGNDKEAAVEADEGQQKEQNKKKKRKKKMIIKITTVSMTRVIRTDVTLNHCAEQIVNHNRQIPATFSQFLYNI